MNKIELSWKSYQYYTGYDIDGDGIGDYGMMCERNLYKYAGFTYNSEKYRAVTFSQYRHYVPFDVTSAKATNNFQIENGYFVNKIYYFKYESLKWRVLDSKKLPCSF